LQTTARPLTNDPAAVATAETADTLEPLIAEEHQMKRVMREFDFWFIALGNCVLQSGGTRTTTTLDQYMACQTCGGQYRQDEIAHMGPTPMCPECGGAEFQAAEDEYGYPMGDGITEGAGCTDVLSPFEYATPSVYTNLADSPGIVRLRWRTKDVAWSTMGRRRARV
jgi:hypothetical protein